MARPGYWSQRANGTLMARRGGKRLRTPVRPGEIEGADLGLRIGAGEGNRTLMTSLEGWGSAIELRPRVRRETRSRQLSTDSVPARRPGAETVCQATVNR